jgi:hypothetical protein
VVLPFARRVVRTNLTTQLDRPFKTRPTAARMLPLSGVSWLRLLQRGARLLDLLDSPGSEALSTRSAYRTCGLSAPPPRSISSAIGNLPATSRASIFASQVAARLEREWLRIGQGETCSRKKLNLHMAEGI